MLEANTVVKFSGKLCRVEDVTENRAVLVPLEKKHITITNKFTGDRKEFESRGKSFIVSPNAELPVIDKAGKRGKQC